MQPLNTRKIYLGITIAVVLIIGALIWTRPKRDIVGSSIQITQPYSSSPVNLPSVAVSDTFSIKVDSMPAILVLRDTSSDKVIWVQGYIRNENYYSKAANGKLAQTITQYFYKGKEIPGKLIITSNLNP